MRELIEFIARTLVERAESVQVTEVEEGRRLELEVDAADVGRIIGRRGRTAQAMRTLLRAGGGALELEILDPDESAAE